MATILESSYDGDRYHLIAWTGNAPRRRWFDSHADMTEAFDLVNNQLETYIRSGHELVRVKRTHDRPAKRAWIIWSETQQRVLGEYPSGKAAATALYEM